MELQQALGQLGLEARETRIYSTLHRSGPASIRDIASASGLNRGVVYEVLKALEQQGLVSRFPKGKRRYFAAEDPDRLLQLAREKQESLSSVIDALGADLIPQLKLDRPEYSDANVRYYEGDEGIELVLKDILAVAEHREPREYYVYSSKPIRKHLYRPFPGYTRQRVRRNIHVKVIALGEGGEDAPLSERKWIPTGNKRVAACYIAVYPPKCALISLAYEDYPTAVVIEAPELAAVQEMIFRTLWSYLPS